VEQLARVSGEPMMAADTLGLRILLQRHVQSDLLLGAALHAADGTRIAAAGVTPADDYADRLGTKDTVSWDWEDANHAAVSYLDPVVYQDVIAGYALVSIDRAPLEADLQQTLRFLVVSTILLILVGVAVASWLAYRLSQPIARLARAGENMDDQRLLSGPARGDEIGKVLETFRSLAEDARRRQVIETAFSRYVSPQVVDRVLDAGHSGGLGGDSVDGSVLFCDIVGFTGLSESQHPAEVANMLNAYFGYLALAAESCDGIVDNYIGDAIMIVFGAPQRDANHALHAMTCGMLIQHLARRINTLRDGRGEATVQFRVGISSGPMLAGNLGSVQRMQYTVVGDTVNVAARLCTLARPGGVMLAQAMLADGQPGDRRHYQAMGPVTLKGRRQNVEVCTMDVDGVAADVDADRIVDHILASAAD
jgi:adenylate cyclase